MPADDPRASRLPEQLPEDPMPLAHAWFEHAQENAGQRNPNSMTLATVGPKGQPSARIVLCKVFDSRAGYLVFYTNYRSAKGRALDADPRVAAVMHWDALGRQLRIEGLALRSPAGESDAYFASRDWGSRLGAWGSDQSRPIGSRAELVAQIEARASKLGLELGDDLAPVADVEPPPIPRPPHWGGFRLHVGAIELWIEGKDRIHDRARWERRLELADGRVQVASDWRGTRLQP